MDDGIFSHSTVKYNLYTSCNCTTNILTINGLCSLLQNSLHGKSTRVHIHISTGNNCIFSISGTINIHGSVGINDRRNCITVNILNSGIYNCIFCGSSDINLLCAAIYLSIKCFAIAFNLLRPIFNVCICISPRNRFSTGIDNGIISIPPLKNGEAASGYISIIGISTIIHINRTIRFHRRRVRVSTNNLQSRKKNLGIVRRATYFNILLSIRVNNTIMCNPATHYLLIAGYGKIISCTIDFLSNNRINITTVLRCTSRNNHSNSLSS